MFISKFVVGFIAGIIVGMVALIIIALAADKHLGDEEDKDKKEE